MFQQRQIQITADGSPTVAITENNLTYHSMYGALQESKHVFIQAGLQPLIHRHETIRIFEMGYGSGLNALLTLQHAIHHRQKIFYHAIELYPLSNDETENYMNASSFFNDGMKKHFSALHSASWEEDVMIHSSFSLHKTKKSVQEFTTSNTFHLIYFDAFDPNAQPELWTSAIFKKMFLLLEENGVLVTYSCKGDVRRAMLTAGFSVEKLPGAKGKREMLRAIKK
ncbi:MAG TPA: tRNA (5-methylaminomethyl-2-thiouridine)(34)-methyltransferase MnmD [Chitinophagaceae bacterium]|nr:tRNA (5-methylaminomethyl-2-thiouridine)(34)-methyltransferase MnmD [Chitinophagaceae bacterium]